MIDICTVIFRDEIPVLKVQAESIAKHCTGIGVRNIYLVVNDQETLVQEIDPAWWGELAAHVLVVPRSAFSTPWVTNGWVSQQLWKLLAASISYNVWSMVLDAKTILTKDLSLAAVFDQQGRARTGFLDIYPVFESSRCIAQDLFEISLQRQIGPGGVPFLLHNDTVRFMIAEIMLRTRTSFPQWFQAQGMLTEFILYSAFVQYSAGSLESLYSAEPCLHPVNLCHSEVQQFAAKFLQMQSPETTSVSIHRNAWQQLDEESRNLYRNLLLDHDFYQGYDL